MNVSLKPRRIITLNETIHYIHYVMTTMTPCRDATPSVSQQYEKEITLLISLIIPLIYFKKVKIITWHTINSK